MNDADPWTQVIYDANLQNKRSIARPIGEGCKGLCIRLYPDRKHYNNNRAVELLKDGWRKCKTCEILIHSQDVRCGCCGKKTSTRRRRNPNKK